MSELVISRKTVPVYRGGGKHILETLPRRSSVNFPQTDGDFYAFKDVTKLVTGKALVNLDIRTKVYATNGFTGQVISSAEVTLFRGRQQIWPMQWDAAGAIRREISEKLQVFV